jgi:hypothetical protein
MLHAHSGLRWIALILIIIAVVNAFIGLKQSKDFSKKDKMINLFTLIFFHIQLLIGLALFFTSPKVQFTSGFMKETILRFFAIEHPLMMLIAIALVTVGYSKSKKEVDSSKKFRKIVLFYTLALIITLIAIPWPFRTELGAAWF